MFVFVELIISRQKINVNTFLSYFLICNFCTIEKRLFSAICYIVLFTGWISSIILFFYYLLYIYIIWVLDWKEKGKKELQTKIFFICCRKYKPNQTKKKAYNIFLKNIFLFWIWKRKNFLFIFFFGYGFKSIFCTFIDL